MKSTIVSRFRTKDNAAIYVNALNEGLDTIIGACNVFAQVANRFNGKVYNKRFVDACNAALVERFGVKKQTFDDGRTCDYQIVHVYKDNTGTRDTVLSFYLFNRCVHLPDRVGVEYFDHEIYYSVRLGGKCFDNGRIIASEFERAAQATADANVRVYNRYRDAMLNWDKHVAKIAEINAYVKEQLADLNTLFVDVDACLIDGGRMLWLAKDYGKDNK